MLPIVNVLRWNNTPSQNGIPLIKTIFFFFLKRGFYRQGHETHSLPLSLP